MRGAARIGGAALALLGLACATEPPSRRVRPAACAPEPPATCLTEPCSDVMFVLDVSSSTQGAWSDGGAGSILEASAEALRGLIDRTQAGDQRIGLIAFSGGRTQLRYWRNSVGTLEPAWVEVPLTTDRSCAARRVADIARRQPYGSTHLARAIDLATVELRGFRGRSRSRARAGCSRWSSSPTVCPRCPTGRRSRRATS